MGKGNNARGEADGLLGVDGALNGLDELRANPVERNLVALGVQ